MSQEMIRRSPSYALEGIWSQDDALNFICSCIYDDQSQFKIKFHRVDNYIVVIQGINEITTLIMWTHNAYGSNINLKNAMNNMHQYNEIKRPDYYDENIRYIKGILATKKFPFSWV
ncbi:MAG: hypothetical protein MGG11_06550 [Trichodesmium sp. MAG_R03]|nr:hypothetical protein [Trichodesmium sp. MAG_R03]